MKQLLSLLLFVCIYQFSFGQIGGDNTYEFLNISSSARISALGGAHIAVKDNDPFLGIENPSLLNKTMDNKLALTYTNYLSDINQGLASYTKNIDSVGTFSLGVKYLDYGDFTETDNAGNEIGSFTAGEYAFIIGYGRDLDTNFSVGMNVKTIISSFYDYNSVGIAADFGATYQSLDRNFTMAVVVKNVGSQLTSYANEDNEDLPFEIQYGLTKRFENVPIRLGLTFQHLNNWDLSYENPNEEESTVLSSFSDNDNEDNEDNNKFLKNLGKHLIFSTEFLISENFNVRLGYNYLKRTELVVDEKLGTIGLSWGFGLRVNRFHLSYGRSAFHQAGAVNTFSVVTKLSDFIN